MNFLGDLGDDLPLPKEKKGERDACGSIESMSPGDFLPPRIKKENVIVDIEKRCKMNKTGNKMSNRIAVMQTVRVCVCGRGGKEDQGYELISYKFSLISYHPIC